MSRSISTAILLMLLAFLIPSPRARAQRKFEEVGKPEPTRTVRPRRQPSGPTRARVRANGVLFVLGDPPAAEVVVKNSKGIVTRGEIAENGEFRAELPPGTYSVEVSAENFAPETLKNLLVRPPQPKIVRADLLPKTGSILVAMGSVESDATILLDGKRPDDIVKKENLIEIDNIPAGSYSLRITHPTIAAWEKEVVVENGARTPVSPKFKLAVVNLTVKSEPGAEVYADGEYQGTVAENGELLISNKIRPGNHTIKAVKDKFETATRTKSFAAGDEKIEMQLKRIGFSSEFSDSFMGGASAWLAPSTWKIKEGKMTVKGPDVGLVRDVIYDDFRMEFDVNFINGKGAAWVVRAQDKKNYYLFQLTGPKGSPPTTFSSYICQNGQLKRLKPPDYVAVNLTRPDDMYHITVEAKGNTIKHFIEVTSDPKATGPEPMSEFRDASVFSFGTVGFATKDDEEFVIRFIVVNPLDKPGN